MGMSTYYATKFGTTGKRIKARLLALGITQTDLYYELRRRNVGISKSFISQVISDGKGIAFENIAVWADALETTTDHLLLRRDDPEPFKEREPEYFSEEADKVARLIDEMPLTMRTTVLQIVTLALDETKKRQRDEFERLLRTVESSVGREARRQVEAAIANDGA